MTKKTDIPVIQEVNEGRDFGLSICRHCGERRVATDNCLNCGKFVDE